MNNHPILFYSYNHSAAKANFYLNTDKINVIYQKPNFLINRQVVQFRFSDTIFHLVSILNLHVYLNTHDKLLVSKL